MNFPNTLSVLRIVLAPVFMLLFFSENKFLMQLSFITFTAAALTDWYDGWYARKYGFKTRWGQFIDPLADKILTSAAFLTLYILDSQEPRLFGTNEFIPNGILIGIIIIRDIILTAIRSYKELKGIEFKTSLISKTKTFIQMSYLFIILGLLFVKISFPGLSSGTDSFLFSSLNYYFLFLVCLITVVSGFAYFLEMPKSEDKLKPDKVPSKKPAAAA